MILDNINVLIKNEKVPKVFYQMKLVINYHLHLLKKYLVDYLVKSQKKIKYTLYTKL